jgi:protein-tyrosine phosphatase
MIEMSVPECASMDEFDGFMAMLVMELNGKNIICHCRGGIGRAGLIGCCVMLKIKSAGTAK